MTLIYNNKLAKTTNYKQRIEMYNKIVCINKF